MKTTKISTEVLDVLTYSATCQECGVEFDVDALVYDDVAEKFGCPSCRSIEFHLLLKGVPDQIVS